MDNRCHLCKIGQLYLNGSLSKSNFSCPLLKTFTGPPFNNMWTLLNQWLHFFPLPSIILVDVSGNRRWLQRVQKVTSVGCDWLISIHSVCFFFSVSVDCHHNYDWRQCKTLGFELQSLRVIERSCNQLYFFPQILYK